MKRKILSLSMVTLLGLFLVISLPVHAQWHGGGGHVGGHGYGGHYHGGRVRFAPRGYRYYPYWGGPTLGWPDYYYYVTPPELIQGPSIYNEPEPQPYYWYYCQDPQGYYPYIQNCPGGWMQVVPNQ